MWHITMLGTQLAASMMPAEYSRAFWAIPVVAQGEQTRVKDIAELLWELSGKPQGSADDDWYRAERVVRHVGAEALYAR